MSDQIDTYQGAVLACALARNIIQAHDLPAILRAIDHADAVGPILDPTAYRQKAGLMAEDRELLEAALRLWRVGRRGVGVTTSDAPLPVGVDVRGRPAPRPTPPARLPDPSLDDASDMEGTEVRRG